MEQCDRRRRCVCRAGGEAACIAPRAVGCFEKFQALHHPQRLRHFALQILIRAERNETAVGIAVLRVRPRVVAAVARAKGFDPRKNRIGETVRHFFPADCRMASRECAEMHEVERRAVAETAQIFFHAFFRNLRLKRLQPCEREDRIIQIRLPIAVSRTPRIGELSQQKRAHQIARVAEHLRRKPGDLQHFEPDAHRGKVPSCQCSVVAESRHFSTTEH